MLLLIDKPRGITSHDVVYKVRKITGEKRVGHAGTLDPLATGLLIVGVGRESTKKLGVITKDTTKAYIAEVFLGKTTTTDDAEGNAVLTNDSIIPSKSDIETTLSNFRGQIEQIPPAYSAIKLAGKKAYELARKGKEVKIDPRIVTIYSIELLEYEYPVMMLECVVSAGTYIRAIARDLGVALHCGAYLSGLRRVAIGDYQVKDAIALGDLTSQNWKSYTT